MNADKVMSLVSWSLLENSIAVLTLDDARHRNALTQSLAEEFEIVVGEIARDPNVRCLVLTARPPVFSAGGDFAMLTSLSQAARGGEDTSSATRAYYSRFFSLLDVPVPTIAAVSGNAVGAGVTLSLLCDMAVVARDATMRVDFTRLGLHPGMATSGLLPDRIGSQRAAHLLFAGAKVTGEEAVTIGLALEACDAEDVMDRALSIARDIVKAAPLPTRELVDSLRERIRAITKEAAIRESGFQAKDLASADFAEALRAVSKRETPAFMGR